MQVHESINNIIILLDNIDYIGTIERPYEWGYKVYLKSGNYLWIGLNDYRERIADDRKKLIEKLKNYTPVN